MDRSLDGLDQEERIKLLRKQIEELGGNLPLMSEIPSDTEEAFLKHVLEYESAQPITLFRLLENAGFSIAAPNALDNQELTDAITCLIERLAKLGAYLTHTNHLSDRELYDYLYNEGLREEAVLFPENPSYAYVIDLTGSGSDEDNQIYLKYYADEECRRRWAIDWPDDPMPESAVAPYDRDSRLPKAPV
jgi:hypothetical protein